VDFLPVANWAMHQNDTAFILFRDLYDLLGAAGKRARSASRYTPAALTGPLSAPLVGERSRASGSGA
jgi:hypothetical protein